MSEAREAEPVRTAQRAPECSNCKKPLRFATTVFDFEQDKTVVVYTCDGCHQPIWI